MLKILIAIFLGTIAIASSYTEVNAEVDCSLLDPRASISAEKEAKVQASVNTLFKIAKAGGGVEGKLKQDIQNLQKGVSVSEQGQIKLRTLFLFCGMVANAKDISTERKVNLFQIMMDQKPKTVLPRQPNINKSTITKKYDQKKEDTSQPTHAPGSISQNMDNSPGSIQIGKVEGPVIINQTSQPRQLTQKQKEILYNDLKPFNGRTVHIIKLGDREAALYADEIIRILTSSGIKVSLTTIGILGPPKYGVFISNKPSIFAESVLKAFNRAGVDFTSDIGLGQNMSREEINILIGLRP